MEFSQKIQVLRNKAQETQAANKIMDMLTNLKLKNDSSTSYRWIWELIQNAKDVVNSSGKVDIVINFDEQRKIIEFKHNGKLFTTKNLVFLIEQVSTKDRSIEMNSVNRTTGKFGTGFLTTHLLSDKVNVSGYLQDLDEPVCSFEILLNRSGKDKESIIRAIQESCLQLDRNTKVCNEKVEEINFNTCFTYNLDEEGIQTARNGLNNLIISAPYVFAFVPEINSITVQGSFFKQVIKRGNIERSFTDGHILEINVGTINNGKPSVKNKEIYVFEKNDVSLAVEVETINGEKSIVKYSDLLPRIYCDFPLLGTNDFSFPVVINCPFFNPTEPRNGIHLTDKEHIQIDENKQRLQEAVEIYQNLLNNFSEYDFNGIYNIVRIPEQTEKEWLSKDWYEENIINKLKSFIKKIPLIYTESGEKKPLFDEFGESTLNLMKDLDFNIRQQVWDLSSRIFPSRITKKEELELWYGSLWEECRNFNLVNLMKNIEMYNNVEELSNVVEGDVFDWLNQLIGVIFSKEETNAIYNDINPIIFPNQEGGFCELAEIYLDCNIDEKYKEVALLLEFNVKNKLLHKNIAAESLKLLKRYTLDNYYPELDSNLERFNGNKDVFYKNIICLKNHEIEKQSEFLKHINKLYPNNIWKADVVSKISLKLLDQALTYWVEKSAGIISNLKSIEEFQNQYDFDNQEAINFLKKFIGFITKNGYDYLFERYNLLPNQYGTFKRRPEILVDSGEIDEILKDVSNYSGYDVREELLLIDISLNLPKSRTIYLENISEKITKYIKENKNNISSQKSIKEVFNKFYLWLREDNNFPKVSKHFQELFNNIHWFYNDNDIAENITKVEKYNDILKKYGVTDIEELEVVLANSKDRSTETSKVELSIELLAQWGISNEEELMLALANNIINADFIHDSQKSSEMFGYVKKILERSKNQIFEYLKSKEEYDLSDPIKISETIYIIQKNNEQIYLIARPSDYGQVIIYYDTERDLLDYEKDCELWVEDGESQPEQITFGKILKLTGVNKIPLRSLAHN